jgi:hypothetical protein
MFRHSSGVVRRENAAAWLIRRYRARHVAWLSLSTAIAIQGGLRADSLRLPGEPGWRPLLVIRHLSVI